jgi:hypothetical protein
LPVNRALGYLNLEQSHGDMMRFKYGVISIISFLFLMSCNSTNNVVRKGTYDLESSELQGIKQYQKGNYEAAFNLLKEPAAWGYKGSQYTLAFMFLKGQHVQQSTILGMGWLGVAKEAKVKEWEELYNSFYAAAPENLQVKIDAVVVEYVKRYGVKAQDVTCTKGITASKRLEVKCHKYSGLGVLYDIDLVE